MTRLRTIECGPELGPPSRGELAYLASEIEKLTRELSVAQWMVTFQWFVLVGLFLAGVLR